MSIQDAGLFELPLAIVDVETTGLTPGLDRLIEVCVFRVEANGAPFRAFDSLIRPHRKSFRTHVHRIEVAETEQAPSFEDVAKRLWHALEGAVVVAHNAQFDIRFLAAEFANVDCDFEPPHLCTRSLPAVLGLAPESTSLEALCRSLCIPLTEAHVARNDARATTLAMMYMRQYMVQRGCQTYRDLVRLSQSGWYRFFDSFDQDVLAAGPKRTLPTRLVPLLPRVERDAAELPCGEGGDAQVDVRQETYSSALLEAVSDYQLSRSQFERLRGLQVQSGLTPSRIRAVHAQVSSWALSEFARDDVLDEQERRRLALLFECLGLLGWAPGL